MSDSINWNWEQGGYDENDEAYQRYLENLVDERQTKQEHTRIFNEAGQKTFQSWGAFDYINIPLKNAFLNCDITTGYTENRIKIFLNSIYCTGVTFKDKKEVFNAIGDVQIDTAEYTVYEEKKQKTIGEILAAAKKLYNETHENPNQFASSFKNWETMKSDLDFFKSYLDKKGSKLRDNLMQAISEKVSKIKWSDRNFTSEIEYTSLYKFVVKNMKESNICRQAKIMFELYGVDTSKATELYYNDEVKTTAVMKNENNMILLCDGEKMVLNRADLNCKDATDYERIKKSYPNDIILCEKAEPIVKLPTFTNTVQSQTLKK